MRCYIMLRYVTLGRPMSALGQKQTLKRLCLMSALPPKADIRRREYDVRSVPEADNARCNNFVAIRLPGLRVPMAFEIGDQAGAEMARGLFPGVGRQVTGKQIEGLLADPYLAAIADSADKPRAGQPLDDCGEGIVHAINRRDLVADEPAFSAVAIELAATHDCLA